MNKTTKSSESIVGSLCREISHLEKRIKKINKTIKFCHNKILYFRLKNELSSHYNRKRIIINIAKNLDEYNHNNELSIKFLLEISQRSIKTF